jgi:hypothetical protein
VAESEVLRNVPLVAIDYVIMAPEMIKSGEKWLRDKRKQIISTFTPEEDEG